MDETVIRQMTRKFRPPFRAIEESVVDADNFIVCNIDRRLISADESYAVARMLADMLNQAIA